MYDYVIITHLPAFYKVNLYNELAKIYNIYVVFISNNTNEKRSNDFVNLESLNFQYAILNEGDFQTRNKIQSIRKLNHILKTIKYKKILVSGWDLPEFWFIVMTNSKNKNCLALESTVMESNTHGVKGTIKKFFLSRISTVFASGSLHVELLKALDFQGNINITKGVGIINKPEFQKSEKIYQKRFLYVGRLSKVKNLEMLIKVFNDLPSFSLTLIGDGEEKEYLKKISDSNIIFKDPIENKKLKDEFLRNDIFILPSISETWGLVVEEALYFGLPVIVSENCGSSELVENGKNGFIINPFDKESIREIILKIDDNGYSKLVYGVEKFSVDAKDTLQVGVY
ncbi:MAG: glycosyltransferase [Sulfuricurvum sp.]|nr:glycosyltransferase [Sulfuricurvum sp.]